MAVRDRYGCPQSWGTRGVTERRVADQLVLHLRRIVERDVGGKARGKDGCVHAARERSLARGVDRADTVGLWLNSRRCANGVANRIRYTHLSGPDDAELHRPEEKQH